MKSRKRINNIILNILAWIVSIICIIPLVLIIFNSLKTTSDAALMNLSIPKIPFALENFSQVFEKGKLGQSFINSMIYSGGCVILCTIFSSMAAFVLSRRVSKLTKVIYMFLVLGLTMPINYVALTKVMMFLGLNNSRGGIILLYTALQLPFAVFLIYGFVGKIPQDIDEAAIIDGCSSLKLFFVIIFPLLKPAIATEIVLTFLNTWNEFVSPLYFLSSSAKWPMTLSVYNFFGMYSKSWNLISADVLMVSLPVIIVYLLGQKYIVAGMTSGSVKG